MNTRNTVLKTVLFLCASNSWALPIVNENVATNSDFTAYADHEKPDLVYVFPHSVKIATDDSGIPEFKYQEMKMRRSDVRASLHLLVEFDQESKTYRKNIDDLLAKNPKLTYVPLAVMNSKIKIAQDIIGVGAKSAECAPFSARVEDRYSCAVLFTKAGRKVFRRSLSMENSILVNVEYSFQGVERQPDGSFKEAVRSFGVGGLLDIGEALGTPGLAIDEKGRDIYFREKSVESAWPMFTPDSA